MKEFVTLSLNRVRFNWKARICVLCGVRMFLLVLSSLQSQWRSINPKMWPSLKRCYHLGTVVCLLTGLTPETVAQMCEILWNYSWVWLPVKLNLRCQLHVSLLPLLHLAGCREWQAGCWLFSSVKQNHWYSYSSLVFV